MVKSFFDNFIDVCLLLSVGVLIDIIFFFVIFKVRCFRVGWFRVFIIFWMILVFFFNCGLMSFLLRVVCYFFILIGFERVFLMIKGDLV